MNEECLILYSFRYALGRRTYAVSEVADHIVQKWHILPEFYKEQIVKDIEQAIEHNLAGDECDINSWLKVVDHHKKNQKEHND